MDTPIIIQQNFRNFLLLSNPVNCNIWEFSFGSQQTAPTPVPGPLDIENSKTQRMEMEKVKQSMSGRM